MPSSQPSATTLRLMACVESFSRHEDGTIGHDDWTGLVSILERELALLTRLACEKPDPTPALLTRAEALHTHYDQLAARITTAQAQATAEHATLKKTTRRIQAVKHAYA
jgi:hypothetical protein